MSPVCTWRLSPAHLFKTFLMNEGEARGTEESPVIQKHHRAINDSTYVSAKSSG